MSRRIVTAQSRFLHIVALGVIVAAPSFGADPKPAAAPTATALAAPAKPLRLPTPEEWMTTTGIKPKPVVRSADELDLIEYREPDVQVLNTAIPPICPEPRREATWEIVFGREGRVEALRQVDQSLCPPMADAWKDSIATWRLRPITRFGEEQIPALIRVTLNFGSRKAKPKTK